MKYYKVMGTDYPTLYCVVDKEDGPFWYWDSCGQWFQTFHIKWNSWSRLLKTREVSKLEVLVIVGNVPE